jgi:acyl dehydratase
MKAHCSRQFKPFAMRGGHGYAAVMKIAELATLVGQQFQPGPWIVIDQARINAFAQCTGDQQFIHTDPQRALQETPFGGTIAHGFLSLSLLSAHPAPVPEALRMEIEVSETPAWIAEGLTLWIAA